MGSRGSGRRRLRPTTGALPAMGTSELAIAHYAAAVALAVERDQLDPRRARDAGGASARSSASGA